MQVAFHIGCFKMFFGIACNANAEFCFTGIFEVFFKINSFVQVYHLF